jgi:hypothetical protein
MSSVVAPSSGVSHAAAEAASRATASHVAGIHPAHATGTEAGAKGRAASHRTSRCHPADRGVLGTVEAAEILIHSAKLIHGSSAVQRVCALKSSQSPCSRTMLQSAAKLTRPLLLEAHCICSAAKLARLVLLLESKCIRSTAKLARMMLL